MDQQYKYNYITLCSVNVVDMLVPAFLTHHHYMSMVAPRMYVWNAIVFCK